MTLQDQLDRAEQEANEATLGTRGPRPSTASLRTAAVAYRKVARLANKLGLYDKAFDYEGRAQTINA